jgi:hypothetical protein
MEKSVKTIRARPRNGLRHQRACIHQELSSTLKAFTALVDGF